MIEEVTKLLTKEQKDLNASINTSFLFVYDLKDFLLLKNWNYIIINKEIILKFLTTI